MREVAESMFIGTLIISGITAGIVLVAALMQGLSQMFGWVGPVALLILVAIAGMGGLVHDIRQNGW